MEFRAYIIKGELRGLQQKDETAFYPQIDPLKPMVYDKVKSLVTKLGVILADH